MDRHCLASLALLLPFQVTGPSGSDATPEGPRLKFVGRYPSGEGSGTEIVSVQARSARVVLTNSETCRVDVIDLSDPSHPKRLARHDLLAAPGEELTSVAFHPTEDYFLAVLLAEGAWARGRLLLVDATTGAIWAELPTGVGPDCVMIDPTGSYALVANEAERFTGTPEAHRSPPGSLTFVDLRGGRGALSVVQLPLPDASGTPGTTSAGDARYLERELGAGASGESVIAMGAPTPEWLEPEYVAFAPDGSRAWITLQESNALALFIPDPPHVEAIVGCGTTRHAADLMDDGEVSFDATLLARREPDAVTYTADGRFVVTADEGDTVPATGVSGPGRLAGGGRTVSVFDAETGAFVGDTGNQIAAALHAVGLYRDAWSSAAGAEPETVVAFRSGTTNWVVAGLEEASALVLISLADPAAPHVVQVVALPAGSAAPEGLAVFARGGQIHVLTANEDTGDMCVFRFVPGPND